MTRPTAAQLHIVIQGDWTQVLAKLGVPEKCLRNIHGPCPVCGGRDRFRFDNNTGRGDFFCNNCGPGDGFKLLTRLHGWTFSEALRHVSDVVCRYGLVEQQRAPKTDNVKQERLRAVLPARINRLLSEAQPLDSVRDVVRYLGSRALWPSAARFALFAHPAMSYWSQHELVGKFPALLTPLCDVSGDVVTVHATFLHNGQKLEAHAPRKLLSRCTGRVGCAARLAPSAAVLGVAEGIETALSASLLYELPVWATTNASLLKSFSPPPEVRRLIVFADADKAGLDAAQALHARLRHYIDVEICSPPNAGDDWNDVHRSVAPSAWRDTRSLQTVRCT
jgi:putative DNA primase/helicase